MRCILILIIYCFCSSVSAQLHISPGAQLTVQGDALLSLENIHLFNNGSFVAGQARVSFTGSQNSIISGTEPIAFYNLHINKLGGSQVALSCDISVSHHTEFSAGVLYIGNNFLDLGNTGSLQNESETSRIKAASGQVRAAGILNAPTNANLWNLGATIRSSQNLGMVGVNRGHEGANISGGLGTPIYRYYQIIAMSDA